MIDDPRERPATDENYDPTPDIIIVDDGWFPFGPKGDYGVSWEEAGIIPPATLREYWEIYNPKTCHHPDKIICEACI